MILKLTTFTAESIEEYDRIFMIRNNTTYSVLAIEETDDGVHVLLNDNIELLLSGIIEPIHLMVLIKEI